MKNLASAEAYPFSWYPLCRSNDLKPGQVRRVQAWGQSLAVFRTGQGQPAALQATCTHMGADLSRGKVVGERLQCPLHHWSYGSTGRCEHIPQRTEIPTYARQTALHCEEHYGLIFACLGRNHGPDGVAEPPFAFPRFANEDGPLWSRPSITTVAAPHHVLVANSFDGQHFATVHDRALLAPPLIESRASEHLSIRYRACVAGQRLNDRLLRAAGIDTVEIAIHCWGGNLMQVYNSRTTSTILVAILPIDKTRSCVFIATVLRTHTGRLPQRVIQLSQLTMAHWLTLAFLKPDLAILEGLELRPRVLLPDADACFIRWMRYWRRLPRPLVTQPVRNGTAPVQATEIETRPRGHCLDETHDFLCPSWMPNHNDQAVDFYGEATRD
jgi:nitrite reductase/ring-hydroxylating ferredoxin subunit